MDYNEEIISLKSRVKILEEIVTAYKEAFVSMLQYNQTTTVINNKLSELQQQTSDLIDRVSSLESSNN